MIFSPGNSIKARGVDLERHVGGCSGADFREVATFALMPCLDVVRLDLWNHTSRLFLWRLQDSSMSRPGCSLAPLSPWSSNYNQHDRHRRFEIIIIIVIIRKIQVLLLATTTLHYRRRSRTLKVDSYQPKI